MEKTDLTKLFKAYYSAKTYPEVVQVEAANFLAISGQGDPSGPDFALSLQALYSTAYTLKFTCKDVGQDFVIPKLEGLWWFDEQKYGHFSPQEAPQQVPRDAWEFTLMIRLPEFINPTMVAAAIDSNFRKRGLPLIKRVHFKQLQEGKCVQMLHVGPFDTEPASLKLIFEFCQKHQLVKNGLHHEIYLSDFRKTAPHLLKTILREPVR